MQLKDLLQELPPRSFQIGTEGNLKTEISSLEYDSREIVKDSIFFAIEGKILDGHLFIPQALRNGAVAIVSERPAPADFVQSWLQVGAVRPYMAQTAGYYFGHPSKQLQLAAVTGTNGKTTTASLIHSILRMAGPSVLISTNRTIAGKENLNSIRTTPEAIRIQEILHRSVEVKCESGVIEVSSHALALDRVYGCRFRVGVFTNLSQDHLDFHGTFENYLASKYRLFDLSYNPSLRVAILNGDDAKVIACPLDDSIRLVTFGMSDQNDVYPLKENSGLQGTDLLLSVMGRQVKISSFLLGRHNIYNLMAAVAACSYMEFPDHQIQAGISALKSVRGRFERVLFDAPFSVFVDYAHTPDALSNLLKLARNVCKGRLILVFGCGGDRDKTKRPEMGRIASELADIVVITSDNPRFESPQEIINQVELGIVSHCSFASILDRREAIQQSFQQARPGDVVLIAGKGHEEYQEINGRRIKFDDARVAVETYDRILSH